MLPCHYACTLRNFLQIKKRQLADFNQVREDLDDLCYQEPNRHQEVTAKLNIINEMIQDKLDEACHLILCIKFGCDIYHPNQGLANQQPSFPQQVQPKTSNRPLAGASNLRTQWGRNKRPGRNVCGRPTSITFSTLTLFVKIANIDAYSTCQHAINANTA